MSVHKVELRILDNRLHEWGVPEYETQGAAAMDIRACVDQNITLYNGDKALVPTGFALGMHETDLAAVLMPRSGAGHKKGLVLGNLVGLLDSDYQGQVFVSAWNRGSKALIIKPGERIAQMMFIKAEKVVFEVLDAFSAETERGEGGFGHTGEM